MSHRKVVQCIGYPIKHYLSFIKNLLPKHIYSRTFYFNKIKDKEVNKKMKELEEYRIDKLEDLKNDKDYYERKLKRVLMEIEIFEAE